MEKREILAALEEIADLMEIQGENPFRVRSFRNGARSLEGMGDDLLKRVEEGTLSEVPGIGETLAVVITELARTGTSDRLEKLRQAVPQGMPDLMAIPGLGPKKTRVVCEKLGVTTVEALEKACREGKVAGLPGFGKRTEEKILQGIAYRRTVEGRFLVVQAWEEAEPLLEHLKKEKAIRRIEVAGSLRRRRETIKYIDLLASVKDRSSAPQVMDRFVQWKGVASVIARGETKSSVRLAGGIQADLRVVEDRSFPYALQYLTGSKDHNTAVRGIARERGMKLNEYGLFEVEGEGERLIPCEDERELYQVFGMDYIPPELRENMGEIDLARDRRLPELVELRDIRGVVHVHTRYSDGKQSLEEMVEAARDMGFDYIGISDHSQSAGYAGGLRKDAILRQHEEIERLNAKLKKFRIFKGIESDIRPDGSLDYPPDAPDLFDFVIASVHSNFNLSEAEQTQRVIRSMEDPHTTVLAHPSGRLLLERDGYAIDMEKVLEAAGRLGVVVEINAHPRRLDLDWRWGNFARAHGVKTAIHPDAHAAAGYHDIFFGVGIARKAGFAAKEVVSTYSTGEFETFLRLRKG